MAQFDFYGTWVDSWRLLKVLVENNEIYLIPDQWYSSSNILLLKEINDELKQLMYQKRRLFIWGKEFSEFRPDVVLQQTGPRKGQYSVGSEYGGPCLDLTLPACYEREGIINLSCGTLTYPKEFRDPKTYQWETSSDKLKNAYKNFCKDFKKVLKRLKFKQFVWVGEDALGLLQNGKARIVDRGI